IVGDTIQLTSGSAITLGNAGDTSNFLTVAKLASVPSATTMTSSGPIGVANSTVAMDSGNLNGLTSTTTGALVVNGVTVNYNTTTDSLATVLQRINSSGAGVVATYNSSTDQVSITSPNGGVSLSDTAGNLVSVLKVATSLASAHHLGNSAKYEVNGGPSQYSLTNTVNNLVPGVNVTLQAATPAGSPLTVSVNLDTSAGSKAVQSFVDAYNAVMDLISKDTAFDSQTKKAGIFLGDPTISIIQQQLQEGLFVSNGTALGLTPPFQDVSTIGLSTGAIGSKPGTTTELQFDSNAFQSALTSNPAAVTQLVNTVMGNLSKQLNATTQPFGPIDTAIQSETNQIIDIQHEIDSQNDILQQQQQALTDEFTQLDQSLAQIQSQSSVGAAVLAGLAGGTTSSSSGSSSTGSSSSTTG
ncbi:MAG TPA: flagellar filament capping protein FliD, partial [Chloroflexota bacterium]